MSVMSTVPVIRCRACSTLIPVAHVETYRPDPEGHLLREIMRNLSKVALCPDCRRREAYYRQSGRMGEFNVMAAPSGVVVAVYDRRKDDPDWHRER